MNHSFIDKLIYYFVPSWQLNTTSWKDLWQIEENKRFIVHTRIALSVLGVGYLLHYFFVDIPLGLTSNPIWGYYRFSVFFGSLLVVCSSFIFQNNLKLIKILYWIVGFGTCWAQARSMIWYDQISPIWAFFVSCSFVAFFRTEPIINFLLLSICIGTQWSSFVETNQNDNGSITGSLIVSYMLIALVLKSRTDEVKGFISTQKQMSTEKNLALTQQAMSEQIRAFLPMKINSDIKKHLRNGFNITQAIDEVLFPRLKTISCLFSDIRGYTQSSKQIEFLKNSALPNIKNSTSIVEEYHGIPRLIGDLVFAYFEDENRNSVLNVFEAANKMLKENLIHNSQIKHDERITRYIIVDHGKALCGNLGGANSSREITALGSPVNRCSRIDQITKYPELREILGNEAIIYSNSYVKELFSLNVDCNLQLIDLSKLKIKIRDFEDEIKIYYSKEFQELKFKTEETDSKKIMEAS